MGLDIAKWAPGEYWFEKAFGISTASVWEHPDVKDPTFWSHAPLLPWAHDLVSLCKSKGEVCFLTKPIAGTETPKAQWLARHFPGVHFLIGSSKKFCAKEGSTLIDDCDANVDEFNIHGGRGILFPRIWNRGHAIADPMAHVKSIL